MTPRPGALVLVLALATGCSSVRSTTAVPHALPRATPTPTRATASPEGARESSGVHPVLAEGGVAYVLLGESSGPAEFDSKIPMSGGWMLGVTRRSAAKGERYTLVGPGGSCVARAVAHAVLGIDYSGSSGASLRGPTHDAVVLGGCDGLARSGGFLLALDGADRGAQWEPLVHLDDEAAPTDRALGEDEVWIHRYGLPGSEVDVVERTVVRYVAPACTERERDVILETEDGHPLAHHPGFSLLGAVRTSNGALVVLGGSDDPEALRVVALSEVPRPFLLDTRLGLLADGTGASC